MLVFEREDSEFPEPPARHICRGHEEYDGRFELAFVEDASRVITGDAPYAVARLALDRFEHEAS